MRALMGEYGRIIVAALVGIFVLGMGSWFLIERLNVFFPETKAAGIEGIEATIYQAPVLIVPDNLKINKGDENFNAKANLSDKTKLEYARIKNNYLKLVKAYEDSRCKEPCESLKVFGLDDIDINKIGSYLLIYQARNKEGQVFMKRTNIIVN